MTPLDPDKVRESFALIRAHTPEMLHELVEALEARLLRDEAFLEMQARIDCITEQILSGGCEIIPFPGHSVKVG